MKTKSKKVLHIKGKILIILTTVVTVVSVFAIMIYNGTIQLNNPSKENFPISGVDVSKYQGVIDWSVLESQDISFAFIKATEGSSYVDPCFEFNISEVQKTDIRAGVYHFFSFESSGSTQADNFLSNIPIIENMLPPVIDLELYGKFKTNPPESEEVWKNLQIMIDRVEAQYGTKPIIYATEISYRLYVKDKYTGPVWIRNVYTTPTFDDWDFWQYTDKGQLDGYDGEEKHIDINVFNGSKEDFLNYS